MSLDKMNEVDAVTLDYIGNVSLVLIDEMDWSDVEDHLLKLQKKLNTYLEFIESGQIYQEFSNYHGRPLLIELIFKFDVPDEAINFLCEVNLILHDMNLFLRIDAMPTRNQLENCNSKPA